MKHFQTIVAQPNLQETRVKNRRLRRMPKLLSKRLQNQLHGSQPKLREKGAGTDCGTRRENEPKIQPVGPNTTIKSNRGA